MSFPDPDKATPEEVREMLTLPPSFGLAAGHPVREDPEHWTLGPMIRTRDSELLEAVNADALEEALGAIPAFEPDYQVTRCSHFGFGWVEHLSFRVLTPEGAPTEIWRWLAAWFGALSDYPCVDDAELSRRQHEEALDNIRTEAGHYVVDSAPEDWPARVWRWLWDEKQSELEARDGRAPYPSREAVHEALRELGLYDKDWD